MSRIAAIVDDFSIGEVSPLVLARLSSAEAKNGLSSLINIIPDPRGPAIGRQGMRHLCNIPATDMHATVFGFEMYEGKSLALVFYDNKLLIFNVSADVLTLQTAIVTPYTADLLHGTARDRHNLKGYVSPDGTKMYLLHASVAPYTLTITDWGTPLDDSVNPVVAPVSFTSKPAEWTGGNNPTTMTFFQDRAWYSGCKDNPETIWGSKVAAHSNFTLPATPAAADAVKFVMQRDGLIKWIAGHSSLLMGTAFGEFIASGSNVTIEPGDIQIDPQSAYGSSNIQPEFCGDEVLYVSADGRKLRSMWWRWLESGWRSQDITYTGEHLTKGRIKDVAYARDPDSIIWMLTGDDKIVGCSYRRVNDEPAAGFFRLVLGGTIGKPTGIASVRDYGRSSLVVAAQVTEGGVTKLHLMKVDSKDINEDELVCLDNYSEHDLGAGVTTVPGLSYLEGETVSLVGDGAVLPDAVVASGEIALDYHYDKVYVGHKYSQSFQTLPYFIYEQGIGHHKKHWSKIFALLYNSFPPKINGRRPPTRHPATPMGEGEPVVYDFIQVGSTGWDRLGKISIEQDIPLPLIVLGIFGEVAVETI